MNFNNNNQEVMSTVFAERLTLTRSGDDDNRADSEERCGSGVLVEAAETPESWEEVDIESITALLQNSTLLNNEPVEEVAAAARYDGCRVTLFCSSCGEHVRSWDPTWVTRCVCQDAHFRELTTYTIADDIKQTYAQLVRTMRPVRCAVVKVLVPGSEVGTTLAQYAPRVAKELSAPVMWRLLQRINSSDADVEGSTFNNFVRRPWNLSATAMADKDCFSDCFNADVDVFPMYNLESKYLDKLLDARMKEEGQERLQKVNRLTFPREAADAPGAPRLSVPIYALPDAVWVDQGVRYVIEFKTIKHRGVRQQNLEKWLRQVACYQLAEEQEQAAGDAAMPTKYLLFILFLPRTGQPAHSVSFTVLDVDAALNLQRSKPDWFEWFREPTGPAAAGGGVRPLDRKKIALINAYFDGSKSYAQVKQEQLEHGIR